MIATRRRPARLAVLACALAVAASGCGFSAELDRERNPDRKSTPTPTRAAPPPVPATPKASPTVSVQPESGCPPSGLRFRTDMVNSAMGLRATSLLMTNCGPLPYELDGYPSIQVLDEAGDPITGVRTVEGTDQVPMAPEDPGPEPLTLAPGQTAYASLYWRTHYEKATHLRVAPEKGRDVTTVRAEDYLDIGPENILGTTAWQPLGRG